VDDFVLAVFYGSSVSVVAAVRESHSVLTSRSCPFSTQLHSSCCLGTNPTTRALARLHHGVSSLHGKEPPQQATGSRLVNNSIHDQLPWQAPHDQTFGVIRVLLLPGATLPLMLVGAVVVVRMVLWPQASMQWLGL